jgi:hypothetical protein
MAMCMILRRGRRPGWQGVRVAARCPCLTCSADRTLPSRSLRGLVRRPTLTLVRAQIGGFKVLSEAGIASGVRRVEAVAGAAAAQHHAQLDAVVRALAGQLRVRPEELPARVAGARGSQG